MNRQVLVTSAIALLCAATTSFAQDRRRTGLVVTTGAAVGLILPVSERVAIRPDISFSRSRVESERSSSSEVETSSVSLAASLLFTTHRWDNLSTYVSPRLSYTRSAGTSVLSSGTTSTTFETTNTGYGLTGSFGVDYRLGERFAVFGETGLTFTRQTSESDVSVSLGDTTARSFGTRSAVGVVFYF
jgi:hypothetical protein